MKILPQVRLGYELGWLVSKMAGSKKKAREDEPRGLMATFFVRGEYRLRHGEAPELFTEKPVIPSGDLPQGIGWKPAGLRPCRLDLVRRLQRRSNRW